MPVRLPGITRRNAPRHTPGDTMARVRIASVSVVALAITAIAGPVRLHAQETDRWRSGIGLSASLGLHGLGLGVDVPILERLAVSGRLEGAPQELTTYTIAAVGARVDLVVDAAARIYVLGLAGAGHCNRPGLDGPTPCETFSWSTGVSPMVGAEIRLTESGNMSAGLEGGYWFGTSAPDLDHVFFAGILRIRL